MSMAIEYGQLPSSNTGVLNTYTKLDYLAFTVPHSFENMEKVKAFFEDVGFTELDFGGMGYQKSAIVAEGGRVYWHPEREEMGIHVRLGAKALGQVGMTAIGMLRRAIDWEATFKRLDIAFDDFDGLLDMDEMYRKITDGEVVMRWRGVLRISGANAGSGQKTGDTVSVGARSSDSYLRVYDKKLEQEKSGKDVSEIDTWVRVELELKSEKSDAFARILADTTLSPERKGAGMLCAELLYGLIDFKEPNGRDDNKSRWETVDWWLDFIGSSSKMKLGITKTERTLEDAKDWVQMSISPTLAMIVLSEPDDDGQSGYDFLVSCIVAGQQRLSKPQAMRLDEYNDQQIRKRKETKKLDL